MQGLAESNFIEEMLEVERNACRLLEEAKEKGNQMVLQARMEARKLIEKTKENLQKERMELEKRLHREGEGEVAGIKALKEETLEKIKHRAVEKREQVLKELRKILFGDWQC